MKKIAKKLLSIKLRRANKLFFIFEKFSKEREI